jgi:hypothetical protein
MPISMTLDEWFAAKLREFENDLEFQREKLLYLLGERVAVLGGIERSERMDTNDC